MNVSTPENTLQVDLDAFFNHLFPPTYHIFQLSIAQWCKQISWRGFKLMMFSHVHCSLSTHFSFPSSPYYFLLNFFFFLNHFPLSLSAIFWSWSVSTLKVALKIDDYESWGQFFLFLFLHTFLTGRYIIMLYHVQAELDCISQFGILMSGSVQKRLMYE